MNKTTDENQPVTKKVLIDTLLDLWENHFLPELNKKADQVTMTNEFAEVKSIVKDNQRRLRDLETDTVTVSQHRALAKRVTILESSLIT